MELFRLISLLILLLLASLFSFLETATVAISEHRLLVMAREHRWAQLALRLKHQLEQVLIFSLFGNSLFNAMLTTVSTMLVLDTFGGGNPWILPGSTLGVTLLIIIFSEAAPKIIAAKAPVAVLRIITIPLYYLFRLSRPLIWGIDKIVYLITLILGIGNNDGTSVDELRAIIADKRSPFHESHRSILLNSLELEQLTVREVIIPLRNVEMLNLDDEMQQLRQQLRQTHHTRLIVYKESTANIIGYIHVKDVLTLAHEDYEIQDLYNLVRKVPFIPDFLLIIKQLKSAQKNRERIFVVVNEYGDTLGIACLEDMLEIVFGDFTTDAPHRSYLMVQESADSFIVDGATLVREFNEAYGLNIKFAYDAMSINGLIMKHLGCVPSVGICFRLGAVCFEVLQVGKFWAERVRVTRLN
jgi:Mg2+/Co2+ transporter CorB